MRHKIYILALLLFACTAAHAEHFDLFKKGKPTQGYSELLTFIEAGDTIGFSNGKRFEIGKFKPIFTNYSAFFGTADNQIIRLPGRTGLGHPRSFIKRYIQGVAGLKNAGVPVVHVIDGFSDEYVIEEKIEVEILLEEWLKTSEAKTGEDFGPLREFLLTTWQFQHIGDFRAEQVARVAGRWILIDWTDNHLLTAKGPKEFLIAEDSIADQLAAVAKSQTLKILLRKVHQEILQIREVDLCDSALVDQQQTRFF